ncbi:DUF6508 domain-containing protein [Kitasatospora sp. NPDC097605]|uniref:DUF6508 domain-containing protein n=1 Tax=Kitasatospora sp. NPDC097605 TaxID=3157226 RepID=UPI00332399C0
MPELTQDSAREIIALYRPAPEAGRGRGGAAPPARPLGMTRAHHFAVEAPMLGLTEEGFDWRNWEPHRDGRTLDPEFIASADTRTLRRIATAHLRLGRFVGGHLEQIEATGLLDTVVDRLQELAENGEI